jgi:hypothetical protein
VIKVLVQHSKNGGGVKEGGWREEGGRRKGGRRGGGKEGRRGEEEEGWGKQRTMLRTGGVARILAIHNSSSCLAACHA